MLKILSSTARVAVTALVLSGFFVASTIGAPGYIKIGDISAGSEEEGHKPFDVMSFEWGSWRSLRFSAGPGVPQASARQIRGPVDDEGPGGSETKKEAPGRDHH